ncbi:hypothetical protein RHMOL_Rhmol08G0089800 [Rhododendron molle]|uniref:Uncharacterized protein n=1 Tax=Rhododendron molle TaxID=49168 RepID=A0ACC0ML78_RHOML|nr:hypothetical protein RHMOL_Rhmol08G0089800 [Rhododendron molle]
MGSILKGQKLSEQPYEDRISNLPNSLIAQILSCLPTKYAVATSVLSTRCKQLWTSITSLDFDDMLLSCPQNQSTDPSMQRSFMSFMRRVLLHHVSCVQRFVDDDLINRFLFGCPVLKGLSMSGCVGGNVSVINIVAPMLTSLFIHYCSYVGIWPRPHGIERKIVLDTPALLYLEIRDDAGDSCYLVENLHHLIRADIFLYAGHGSAISEALSDLLKGMSNIQFLKLDFSIEVTCMRYCQLPKFPNMTCLELGENFDVEWEFLLELLENSPRLETLVFKGGLGNDYEVFTQLLRNPARNVPSCLLSHLKVIGINDFRGEKKEWEIVNYFLYKSKVLEKVNITYSGGPKWTIHASRT